MRGPPENGPQGTVLIAIRNGATGVDAPNTVLVIKTTGIANGRSIAVGRVETESEPWPVIAPATVITATSIITAATVVTASADITASAIIGPAWTAAVEPASGPGKCVAATEVSSGCGKGMSSAVTAVAAAESMAAAMALRKRRHWTEDSHRHRESHGDDDCLNFFQEFFFHIFLPNLAVPKGMRVAFPKRMKALGAEDGSVS